MAHGGGGRCRRLLEELFLPAFSNPALERRHDARWCRSGGPGGLYHRFLCGANLLFPGGDLGSLAVHGTVNDLAMAGARPLFLSAGFILEEGLPRRTRAVV